MAGGKRGAEILGRKRRTQPLLLPSAPARSRRPEDFPSAEEEGKTRRSSIAALVPGAWCLVGLEISRTWSISSVALVSLVELILSKASYHSTISCPMKYQGHIMAGFGATPPGYLEG